MPTEAQVHPGLTRPAVTDPFARSTATQAHKRATQAHQTTLELAHTIATLQKLIPDRPRQFVGRCALCGEPARRKYCRAHEWAA